MTRKRLRIRAVKRREIDEDKLSLALWLLAKAILEGQEKASNETKTPEREEAA